MLLTNARNFAGVITTRKEVNHALSSETLYQKTSPSFLQASRVGQAPVRARSTRRLSLVKCTSPYNVGLAHPVSCRKCLACLLNRRRAWTHRLILEATQHADSAFVTLTYSDESLPAGGSLSPEHVRNWLKRFRKSVNPQKIRFYLCGEYGEKNFRPHYHVALFGWPACPFVLQRQLDQKECGCAACLPIRESWKLGRIYSGTLESDSAQYIAGYVTKKLYDKNNPLLLRGNVWLHPEFQRYSKSLGVSALWEIASEMIRLGLDESMPDVPSGMRHGKKILPLDRFLKRKLRSFIGKEENTPQVVLDQLKEELLDVRAYAFNNSLNLQEVLRDQSKNKLLQLETRQNIFKTRRSI